MIQLILAIVLTMSVVVFGMVNTHHVALFYLLGEPIQIRLITLVAVAFFGGVITTMLYQMIARVIDRARIRHLRMLAREEEE